MIAQFNCTGDWAFYLEGDEVIHEQDYAIIRAAMEKHLDDKEVEALVLIIIIFMVHHQRSHIRRVGIAVHHG